MRILTSLGIDSSFLLLILALASCEKKDDATPKVTAAEMSLSSFSPSSGETGIDVTITGVFPASGAPPLVSFGGVSANIKTDLDDQLIVTVPETALTGKISVSLAGKVLTFNTDFGVKPKISSFTPVQGTESNVVTINGSGFDASSIVKFNGILVTPTSIAITKIITPLPVGITSGSITVTNGDLTGTSVTDFFVIDMFALLEGGANYDEGYSVATDAAGNVYVTGSFLDQSTVGGENLTSVGSEDIFIVKYTADLDVVWVRQAGGASNDRATSIDIDASGNVYLSGYTNNGSTFGTFTAPATGGFVARLSPAGTFEWLATSGGGGNTVAKEVRVVGTNVYTIGTFTTFVTWSGQPMLTTTGSEDIFVARLNSANGSALLAKKYGSTNNDGGISITSDGTSMYISGSFDGSLTLGTTIMTSAGSFDGFVAKLDALGNPVWARPVSGSSNDNVYSVGLDGNGKVYTTGYFTGTSSFSTQSLTASGMEDIFVAKYDGTTGSLEWAKRFGGVNYENGMNLRVQVDGKLFLTGYYSGTMAFGPITLNASPIFNELFVAHLDASGTPLWAVRGGGADFDQGSAISVFDRTVYVTGFIRANSDFGLISLTPVGQDCIVGRIHY